MSSLANRGLLSAVAALATLSTINFAGIAAAQDTPPGTPVGVIPEKPGASTAPGAATGFQMALRTGYAIPMGKATGEDGDDLSKSFGGQVPIIVDLGGKLHPNIFLGGYAGIGIGGAGSEIDRLCANGVSCATATFRIGAQLQYHFAPADAVNPWIGYGIGFESTALAAEGNGKKASLAATGFEFGHFMLGVDFRVSRTFGVGPFVDLAVAQYSQLRLESGGQSATHEIDKKALHQWLTIGPRFVFWP